MSHGTTPVTSSDRVSAAEAFRRLERWGSERSWQGTDPYDGLNATRFVHLFERSVVGRRLLTQAVKRSPVDLRPLLGIPPAGSAATDALVLSAYAVQGLLAAEETAARIEETAARLLSRRLPGFDETCFGYHFDVQTRVFFYPHGSPNTIATAFAGLALLDAYERTGQRDFLTEAEGVATFFVRHVPQTEADDGAYFGYLVGDRTPIHNASMLVAAVLGRVAAATGSDDLRGRAEAALRYTLVRQRPDGSWPYGEKPGLEWVDGFHTAYVLECVDTLRRCGFPGCAEPLRRGLSFYADELFLADGTPKYMPDSTHPVDGQCAAEALRLFALASDIEPAWLRLADRTFAWAERELARPDGAYAFQKERLWTNRQPHLRWVEAPFLLALATYASVQAR